MDNNIYDIAVVGLGYIGLPTATIFASKGKRVAGVDVKQSTVDSVNQGLVPFVEPDLAEVLKDAVVQGNLVALSSMPAARAYILALPTPLAADKGADLTYLFNAVDAIAPLLKGGELVVIESTSPPGTTEKLGQYLVSKRSDLTVTNEAAKKMIHMAHSPERVLPGRIMIEIVKNDRVIGGLTPVAAEMAKELYALFCCGEIHLTDSKTAEMTKLVENTFRDVNIAFANELSMISDKLGIDVWRVIELANHHPRVNVLSPGPGVGGHCIAVDPWFIVDAVPEESILTRTAREVNDSKPFHVVDKVLALIETEPEARVAVLGLTFKANIDDVRESPSVTIVEALARRAPDLRLDVVDPNVFDLPWSLQSFENVKSSTLEDALDAAQVVLLLVDHAEFASIEPSQLHGKKIIDTKGIWRDMPKKLADLDVFSTIGAVTGG